MLQTAKAPIPPYYAVPDIKSEDILYMPGREPRVFSIFSTYMDPADYSEALNLNLPYEDPRAAVGPWSDSSPLIPELDSFDAPLGGLSSLSPPAYDNHYVPMDENNYLTWSYDGTDVNPSFYTPSTLPSHPASPSMSIVSASTDDSALSPPPSLAEFSNVFDFDFNSSLPNDLSSSSPSQWLQTPSLLTPSCPSPAQSSVSTECDSRPARSRDSSPNQSDNDQNNPRRRYPCLILGCTRRFTSQYTLKVHMEAHKPKPRVSFPCTLGCSEKFSRQHDRLRHEVAKHGKVCEFSCEDCGRFFSTKKTLGNHKCPVAQGTRWVNS